MCMLMCVCLCVWITNQSKQMIAVQASEHTHPHTYVDPLHIQLLEFHDSLQEVLFVEWQLSKWVAV